VKIINRASIPDGDEEGIRREVSILQKLNHPNIVKVYDFFEEPERFYVVLEFLAGGELFDRIVEKSVYNEKEARDVFVLVLNALKHCHDQNIAHRDLKPENLLLASKNNDAEVKIADFGFAKKNTASNTLATQCGTPGYVAPEIIEGKEYDVACDMWSMGVILYVLIGGYPPFHEDDQKKLFRLIRKGKYSFDPEYWDHISSDAKDLISKLLTVDSSKRYTCAQALLHPWINRDGSGLQSNNLGGTLAVLRETKDKAGKAKFIAAVRKVSRMEYYLSFSSVFLTFYVVFITGAISKSFN
jgi:calcium/calmodulin-dependent protein kinase I